MLFHVGWEMSLVIFFALFAVALGKESVVSDKLKPWSSVIVWWWWWLSESSLLLLLLSS